MTGERVTYNNTRLILNNQLRALQVLLNGENMRMLDQLRWLRVQM